MAALVAMGFPPEVHAAALRAGPGSGPTTASAAAWSTLSTAHASAAIELSTVLSAVQTTTWQGPGGESYLAAHALAEAWLTKTTTEYAQAAAAQECAATAYDTALTTMPTVEEITGNRAALAALIVTNLFGINLFTIAAVEAAYMRMWIQAATTMSFYQAICATAIAATPHTTAAPQIFNPYADVTSAQAITAFTLFTRVAEPVVSVIALTFLFWNVYVMPAFWAAQPFVQPPLGGGAGIGLPVSLPLGIGRHIYDIQMMAVGMVAAETVGCAADDRSRPDDRRRQDETEPQPGASANIRPVGQLTSSAVPETRVGTPTETTYNHIPIKPSGLNTLVNRTLSEGPQLPLTPATWTGN